MEGSKIHCLEQL